MLLRRQSRRTRGNVNGGADFPSVSRCCSPIRTSGEQRSQPEQQQSRESARDGECFGSDACTAVRTGTCVYSWRFEAIPAL